MTRKPVNLQKQAQQGLEPGFVGKRYALCSDGEHHLVLAILENGVVDTQCCADVTISTAAQVEEENTLRVTTGKPCLLCETCWTIHFGRKTYV